MSDEELIESLRLWNRDDAADRIEELERERDGIREAAWMEALDAAHQYTLMQYGMAFLKDPVDRARIIDMIGQRE